MPATTVLRAACQSVAMLAAWMTVVAESAGQQQLPSLSGAISSDAPDMWSGDQAEFPSAAGAAGYHPAPLTRGPDEAPVFLSGESCATCNNGQGGGGYPYNRCSTCNSQLFPWITGPGNCDNWCVGPNWNVEVDALMIRRDNVDWDPIAADVGLTPDLADQFGFGPGARVFATAYNDSSFGLQVGYEGINEFNATALFPAVGASRTFDYQSTLNSLELNLLRRTDEPLKIFAGVRYIEVDEDLVDINIVDKTVPAPSTPSTVTSFTDDSDAFLVENRLIGFQAGGFRDAWQLNRWITIEPFGNAGVYFNNFKREDVDRSTTTTFTSDDPATAAVNETAQTVSNVDVGVKQEFSEIAFLGEAGITAVVRVNRCVALRSGYQIMAIDGVGQGIDSYFAPGLDPTTLVYHGLRFGIEYQR